MFSMSAASTGGHERAASRPDGDQVLEREALDRLAQRGADHVEVAASARPRAARCRERAGGSRCGRAARRRPLSHEPERRRLVGEGRQHRSRVRAPRCYLIYQHARGRRSGSQPDPDGERRRARALVLQSASRIYARGWRSNRRRPAASLADLLRRARFEVLPLDGTEEAVRTHLGADVKVTVTASPTRGLDATLRADASGSRAPATGSSRTSRRGWCTDRSHLDEMLDRLLAGGITEVFVLAGDPPEPAGEFHGAADLLEAMGPRRAEFEAIGITGYPESHHLISRRGDHQGDVRQGRDGHPHRQPALLRRRGDHRLGREGPAPWHEPSDLDRRSRQRLLHEAPARVDKDRAGRVDPLPAPPPGLALTAALAASSTPNAGGELDPLRRSSPPRAWPASTSTRSTRWRGRNAGGGWHWSVWPPELQQPRRPIGSVGPGFEDIPRK